MRKGDRNHDTYWKPWLSLVNLTIVIAFYGIDAWFIFSASSPALQPWSFGEAVAAFFSLGGPLLRLWAMHTLGKTYFTFAVTIRHNHELITAGPYRILLHPSYTGLIAGVAGLMQYLGGPGLWFRSWIFWCLFTPSSITALGC